MTVKEMREKLNDLDWCDEDEILVEFDDEEYSIMEVYDRSSKTQYPDGSWSATSISVIIKAKIPGVVYFTV
jgi:hypothetical protein